MRAQLPRGFTEQGFATFVIRMITFSVRAIMLIAAPM
jgi:hypothetical protein